ncbi:MAG: sigma-70 family RNA polymerase sigma factor [Bacteroidota bacterium]
MTEELHILLKGCIKYDRLSQEKLYRQFYPALFVLCNKFFDDEQDIITALNNGMMKVFNNIEKFDKKKGDLSGWIYVVVRNAAISHVREKNKQMVTQEISAELQIESSQNPFKDASSETVIRFLNTLSVTTRAVFNLFYMEGFLIKEIALQLDMKEGTVKWHLNEGRNKLKITFNNNVNNKVYAR